MDKGKTNSSNSSNSSSEETEKSDIKPIEDIGGHKVRREGVSLFDCTKAREHVENLANENNENSLDNINKKDETR